MRRVTSYWIIAAASAGLAMIAGLLSWRLYVSPMPLAASDKRAAPAPTPTGIRWRTDFSRASAEAKESRKPLLVEFYADWCPPCRLMDDTTFQDAGVIRLTESFVPTRIDLDENPALAERFGVMSIPQAFILSPDGKRLLQANGYHEAREFIAFLREGLAKKGQE